MIDVVIGSVFFVCEKRLVDSGASLVMLTAVIPAWAGPYTVCSLIIGRFVTSRNAASFILAGCLLAAAVSFGLSLWPNFGVMYALVVILSVATSMFFTPFQIFMKQVASGRPQGVVRSTSLYTLAWSLGIAAGPFIGGFIYELFGWRWCFRVDVLFALATAAGILMLRHHAHGHPKQALPEAPTVVDRYAAMPDLAWLGWICSGVGCAAIQVIFATFPMQAERFGVPTEQQGMIIATMYVTQGLVGLALFFSKRWMYQPVKPALFGLCGIAALVLLAVGQNAGCFFLAVICFGIYSGSFYFYLVFHSLVHPALSPRYISINEAVVGVMGVFGPLMAGQVGKYFGLSVPYYTTAALIAAAVIFQFFTVTRVTRRIAGKTR